MILVLVSVSVLFSPSVYLLDDIELLSGRLLGESFLFGLLYVLLYFDLLYFQLFPTLVLRAGLWL